MAVKQPPVLSVAVDESTQTQSTMVACAHYLNHRMEPTTNFWVALKAHAKDHNALLNAVVDCFTTSPDAARVPQEDMLTRDDIATELLSLTGDGASVVGTQRGPASRPRSPDRGPWTPWHIPR